LIEALGGEGRTGLGQDLPASLQTPAAQNPTAAPAAPRAAASGRGALTGPALAPADTAPEEAPFYAGKRLRWRCFM
ncbi:hypothetical protein ACGTRS_33735, partial [Burkholderia semiarida]